jgi:hypothetical protein
MIQFDSNLEKIFTDILKDEPYEYIEPAKNIIYKIFSLKSYPCEEEIDAIKSDINNLHPKVLFNLFKTLKFVCDEWITPIKPKKLFTLNDQSEEENLKNLFKNFYHHCFYLSLNFIQSGAYNDKELNFFLNATFEKNSTIPDEELEIIFEKLSFFNKELPEAVEPANLFNDFVKDVDFFTDLTHKVIYFAEFCLENQKIKNAESALRYCYLYMRDIEYDEPYQGAFPELLENLIYVSIMLGKYSQALRYLEELKDLYLREEISWEYYAEVLTKYGSQIVQEDIKSISIDFNLIYELYNELKKLRDENRKLSETLSEYQSPETILKNFFGIFWDNLDEISKQNLIKAKKSEILLKENNEVFRDIILGYYDAVACEIQKLNQKIESTIPNIDINQPERIDNPFKKFETLILSNIKEVKDLLNKETVGGSKIIKLQYHDYIKPLTRLRNELAHQSAKIVNQDEINEFLSNKLHGILKFIISIQPRLV